MTLRSQIHLSKCLIVVRRNDSSEKTAKKRRISHIIHMYTRIPVHAHACTYTRTYLFSPFTYIRIYTNQYKISMFIISLIVRRFVR